MAHREPLARVPTVGLVGVGAWGQQHLRVLKQLRAVCGLVEIDPTRRAKLEREHPELIVYSHLDGLLAQGVDAVLIATPAHTHYQLGRRCLEQGIDVFLEKPMALSMDEAEQLVAIAEQRQAILMVGHILLFQPIIGWAKRFLRRGGLGRLQGLHHRRLGPGSSRPEGALWDLAVHNLAVTLHLVDAPVVELRAETSSQVDPSIDDDVHLHLVFSNGVRAHHHVSSHWPEKERRMTLIGDGGMLTLDELTGCVRFHALGPAEGAQGRLLFSSCSEPLAIELRHFLRRVRDRQVPLSSGQSALDVVRLLASAQRCAQTQGSSPQ